MKTLEKINEQISKLQKARTRLINKNEEELVEKIKQLDWLKNFGGHFDENPLSAAGLPKYRIFLNNHESWVEWPKISRIVTVMGDSKFYEYNIVYRCNGVYGQQRPCFTTDNYQLLIEFIKKAPFKWIDYFSVLDKTRQILDTIDRFKNKNE
ncbi:MAG: hypothetical protein ACFFG0_27395 [Candidatus Thorarchaeota archaeon]